MSPLKSALAAMLLVPTMALAGVSYPSSTSSSAAPFVTSDGDPNHKIICNIGGGFVSTQQAQELIQEFNDKFCIDNPNTAFVLKPDEVVLIDEPGDGVIVFANTKDQVAAPPNCGEVVEDFQDLLAACFTPYGGSDGAILIEMAGGGKTDYVIVAEPQQPYYTSYASY
jgi:hypothetical protein